MAKFRMAKKIRSNVQNLEAQEPKEEQVDLVAPAHTQSRRSPALPKPRRAKVVLGCTVPAKHKAARQQPAGSNGHACPLRFNAHRGYLEQLKRPMFLKL